MMGQEGDQAHMTTQIDWAAAKAAMPDVAARAFGEIPRDRKVRCPFHADGSPSLHIYDDGWHCYGCGEGGDAVDLVARLDGVGKLEAYRRIMGTWQAGPLPLAAPAPRTLEWQHQAGAQGVPEHPRFGPPHVAYPYRDREGHLVGYVCRWDRPGRLKDVRPASSVLDLITGELRWEWVSLPEPRPLYRPDCVRGKLIVVEGEKCADHLRALGIEACSWPGGSNAVAKADWSMVTAGTVYIWPDNDEPGHAAAAAIASALEAQGCEVLMVPVDDLPPGSDAADLDDKAAIVARIRSSLPPVRPSGAPQSTGASPDTSSKPQAPANDPWPFRCLGQRDGRYYFLEHEGQTVLEKTNAQLSRSGMLDLAPLEWYCAMFPKKDGWDHEKALNAVIRASKARIYTDESQRGCGIWWDAGRIVYHSGGHLLVDGIETRLTSIASDYAYPASPPIAGPAVPLSDDEAAAILDAACIPSWEDSLHGHILAGWVMCAFLAGVLPWRPSLWIQGAAGSGKTDVIKRYIHRLLGDFAIKSQGDSTPAGIRQRVRCDARPVVMDESEPNSEKDSLNIAGILQIMRQASSDSDAQTFRGTPSGRAQSFHVRSPFCFGSIQNALERGADTDRVTILRLKNKHAGQITQAEADAVFTEWKAACAAFPADVDVRLRSRAIALALIARDVVAAMSSALLSAGGVSGQREADQLGALMAGSWLMCRSRVPTEAESLDWCGHHAWASVLEKDTETDAEKALRTLLDLPIQGDGDRASVRDRLHAIASHTPGSEIAERHSRVLAWFGLRLMPDGTLFVAKTNENRKAAMKAMPYGADLVSFLRQVPGAQLSQQRIAREGQPGRDNPRGVLVPIR